MRHIDISALQVDQKWLAKALQLQNELAQKDPEGRKNFLNQRRNQIWGLLKDKLEAIQGKKCWYCEAKLFGRAPYHVDHFRPKKGSDRVEHDGYWWLAYDHNNYRLACPTCNSSGKGDNFPLEEGSPRATCANGLSAEMPLLLDPTAAHDPKLLDFLADGTIIPRIDLPEGSLDRRRASKSIELFRLDDDALKEERKGVQKQLQNCLELCNLTSKKERLEEHLKTLLDLIEPYAAFSAFSKARFEAYKDHAEYSWLVRMFEGVA